MSKIHTHYDNLKVARNAPPEVIRAAYKILSQKYHPDRNPGNPESARIMAIINGSYEILADPDKRKAHDLWIAVSEHAVEPVTITPSKTHSEKASSTTSDIRILLTDVFSSFFRMIKAFLSVMLSYVLAIGGLVAAYMILAFIVDLFNGKSVHQEETAPRYSQTPAAQVAPEYVRPVTAPNGKAWPTSAGYVNGYERLNFGGLSSVKIDNSQNDADVFVKLVHLDAKDAYPVRQIYIPAYRSFTLSNVRAGNYDVRYRDLSTGGLAKTEPFLLKEMKQHNGTSYSNLTMTLYKVNNGNMQTFAIPESQF